MDRWRPLWKNRFIKKDEAVFCGEKIFCYHSLLVATAGQCYNTGRKGGNSNDTGKFKSPASEKGTVSRGIGRTDPCSAPNCFQMGKRSFPKLKIPHQSHADFCSTDTAGGLDNKKRRYAPRGGGSVPPFLVGVSKGGNAPIWHTTLRSKV